MCSVITKLLFLLVSFVAILVGYLHTQLDTTLVWENVQNLTNGNIEHRVHTFADGRKAEYFWYGNIHSVNDNTEYVIITPGTLQTSHFFTLSADDYAKKNIIVAAITLPGSGSDPSNYPFNAETYVENDLKKIISAVIPPKKKFLVVGVSMGGAVAAHLSSAYDLDRNDKTLLVIPVSPLNPADAFVGQHLEDTSNFRFITKNTILKKIFSWFIYFNVIRKNGVLFSKNEQFTATRPQHKSHFRPKLSDDFLRSVKYGSVGIRHAFDIISAPWTVDWKKLGKKKVIIASGTLDDTTQPSMQKYLHAKIPNSEMIEFDGAHLDFVEIFDDLIYKTLNRE